MSIDYLMWANILVWAGIGLYVLLLSRKQLQIDKRMEQLEISSHERKND